MYWDPRHAYVNASLLRDDVLPSHTPFIENIAVAAHRRLARADVDFSEARVRSQAQLGQILLSFVNRVRLDFAHTWVAHVRRLGIRNYLVGATDAEALKGLLRADVQCFSMATNLPQGEWPWGSPSFKSLGPHKIELIYKTISWGLEVLITDIDALVLREPFAYMARWPDAVCANLRTRSQRVLHVWTPCVSLAARLSVQGVPDDLRPPWEHEWLE